MDRDLFLAILAMDAYNQGYDRGLEIGALPTHDIGNATFSDDDSLTAQAESFYAVSYTPTSAVGDLANGSKIISNISS